MEVEAVTLAIQWLASQLDAQITHAIILQKVESGMGWPDWHTAMHSLRLQRLLWIYCPGHVDVSENELVDRLMITADITSGLQLGKTEVLRGLRNFSNIDRPEHHSTDGLKGRGVEKGRGRQSTLRVGNDLCSTRRSQYIAYPQQVLCSAFSWRQVLLGTVRPQN